MTKSPDPDQRSPEETERRSRATLKNLIATPPKGHEAEKQERRDTREKKKQAEQQTARDPWKRPRQWP
jgi:hypothetical protein